MNNALEHRFVAVMHFYGIYRDDGIAIFQGGFCADKINHWLSNFQSEINKVAGNDFLQFTMDVWCKTQHRHCLQQTIALGAFSHPSSRAKNFIQLSTCFSLFCMVSQVSRQLFQAWACAKPVKLCLFKKTQWALPTSKFALLFARTEPHCTPNF